MPPHCRGFPHAASWQKRIRQSVCRWCYKDLSVDQLCQWAVQLGLKGVDLLEVEEYEIPRRYGLICTMGYAGGGTIADAINRVENHASIEAAFRKNIPIAAKAGVPNVITFSGNRRGMSDEEGARNTITRPQSPQDPSPKPMASTSVSSCSTAR